MGTQRVQMKGVLPWLAHWALRAGTIDFCPALAALVCYVQNIVFLALHYFNSFVPIAQQARKAIVPGHLSLNMWLWDVQRAGEVGRRKQKRRLFAIWRVREAVKRSGEAGQQTL
jgi:hypothetical protein